MKGCLKKIIGTAVLLGVILGMSHMSVVAETGEEKPAAARRVDFTELDEDDRFVIVHEKRSRVLCTLPSANCLAGMPARSEGETILSLPEETAVFSLERGEDGSVLLKAQDGYLTSYRSGNGVYFSREASECSRWQMQEGGFLYNSGAVYVAGSDTYTNFCLEYYHGGRYFNAYQYEEGDDPTPFALACYRLEDGYELPEGIGDEEGYRLPLFETSDIHGYMVNTANEEYEYRLSWIAGKVDDKRRESGEFRKDRTVLLDGGDIFQGNTLSNLLEGKPLSAAFAAMDYDAVTVGNHEFDWGLENVFDPDGTLLDYQEGGEERINSIPVIVSNLYQDGRQVPLAGEYIILDKTAVDREGHEVRVKIGVIGFAGDYSGAVLERNFAFLGYEIREDYDALVALAKELEESGACDATIVLTHSDAAYLAGQLERDTAIDLILGGHVHSNDVGRNGHGIPFAMPAGQGKACVTADLVFALEEGGRPVLRGVDGLRTVSTGRRASDLYDTEENAQYLDPDILRISRDAVADMEEVLAQSLGYITVPVERFDFLADSGDRSSTAGNWHASLAARMTGSDIGFYNQTGMRDNLRIPEGEDRREVTVSDIYTLFPFSNLIYSFELTGDELLELLEYSLTPSGTQLFSVIWGIDCYFSDMTVNALVKDGEVLYADGEWKNGHEADTFRVACSEFLATTDRPYEEMHNPLCAWKDTDRLISSDVTDVEGALRVLREEAAENGGHLGVDTRPHYLNKDFDGKAAEE